MDFFNPESSKPSRLEHYDRCFVYGILECIFLTTLFRGYPAKRALSDMRKHGGYRALFWQDTIDLYHDQNSVDVRSCSFIWAFLFWSPACKISKMPSWIFISYRYLFYCARTSTFSRRRLRNFWWITGRKNKSVINQYVAMTWVIGNATVYSMVC